MDHGLIKMKENFVKHRNIFLMDLENSYLHEWDSFEQHPTGPRRFEHPRWGVIMRRACEAHSDVTFEEYCQWCLAGFGDEWFRSDLAES